MSFKELNSLIVFFKKQEAECTDANELVIIKDNIVNAYAKIKDIVDKQDSELTVKTENSSQNQNVRLIERTLAAQPTFYGTDTVEAEGFLNKMEQLWVWKSLCSRKTDSRITVSLSDEDSRITSSLTDKDSRIITLESGNQK